MRVIIIDSVNRSIREGTINGNFLTAIYKLIGCTSVDVVGIDHVNDVWVDDEGLLKNEPFLPVFKIAGRTLAGNAVISAHDDEGETIATDLKIDDIRSAIQFLSLSPAEIIRILMARS